MSDGHFRQTYNDIHLLCQATAIKIKAEFNPDLMIAIGGGGFIPARILRTFLKTETKRNIPIQAIGLSLYEALPGTSEETLGTEVIRTQWLDFSTLGTNYNLNGGLLGRRILVVDEVDDSRSTLSYALAELQADVKKQLMKIENIEERERLDRETKFAVFVVHNKLKKKAAEIPGECSYYSGLDVEDVWIDYPWEMPDILKHDELRLQDLAAEKK